MDFIVRLDTQLFYLINTRLTAHFLDVVMPYITNKLNFTGAVISAAILILILGKRRDRRGLAVLLIVVVTADLTGNILKHLIMRVRPCNALEGARLLVGCGRSYSMPSNHSINIFAAMVFLTARYRRFFPLFLFIAFTVAYSRVYVGVHYPLDVTVGAVLGSLIAIGFSEVEKRLTKAFTEHYRKKRGSVEV